VSPAPWIILLLYPRLPASRSGTFCCHALNSPEARRRLTLSTSLCRSSHFGVAGMCLYSVSYYLPTLNCRGVIFLLMTKGLRVPPLFFLGFQRGRDLGLARLDFPWECPADLRLQLPAIPVVERRLLLLFFSFKWCP